MFDGNSLASVTTLSPGCQGSPSATKEMPLVVFGIRAISAGSALIIAAAVCRRDSIRWAHLGQIVSPCSAASVSH
jgi:hypothetical protein